MHTHLITSLILNRFSICKSFGKLRLRAFQPYYQIVCFLKHVKDVKDRLSTLKGYNATYVKDVKDVMLCMSKMGKEHAHTFLLITFLIFN